VIQLFIIFRSSGNKYLKAIELGKPIVTAEWLFDCIKRWNLLPMEKYLIVKPIQQKEFYHPSPKTLKETIPPTPQKRRDSPTIFDTSKQAKYQKLMEKKVFCFSGNDVDKKTKRLIYKLGGAVITNEGFNSQCTHVIIPSIKRTEKFLCGVAAGKWILKQSYLYPFYYIFINFTDLNLKVQGNL
jgi:hypothetical protein